MRLVDSIKELGVLQPVLVREADDGYELIAGERRLAGRRRAGLPTIPAVSVRSRTTCRRSSRRWWRTSTART